MKFNAQNLNIFIGCFRHVWWENTTLHIKFIAKFQPKMNVKQNNTFSSKPVGWWNWLQVWPVQKTIKNEILVFLTRACNCGIEVRVAFRIQALKTIINNWILQLLNYFNHDSFSLHQHNNANFEATILSFSFFFVKAEI